MSSEKRPFEWNLAALQKHAARHHKFGLKELRSRAADHRPTDALIPLPPALQALLLESSSMGDLLGFGGQTQEGGGHIGGAIRKMIKVVTSGHATGPGDDSGVTTAALPGDETETV